MLHYRNCSLKPEILAALFTERRAAGEEVARLKSLLAAGRADASDPERIQACAHGLIDVAERLATINAKPLRQELDDISSAAPGPCFEKDHLIRRCHDIVDP